MHYFWNNAAVSNHTVLYAPLAPLTTKTTMTTTAAAVVTHTIHIFLDGCNLEVFANERVAITTNIFPTMLSATCVGAHVLPTGGTSIGSIDVYRLADAPVTGAPP